MIEEIEYNTLDENFQSDVKELIGENYINFFYLIKNIEFVIRQRLQFHDAWLMKSGNNNWIFGFSANGQYHLYGLNWTESLINKCFERMPFSKFPNNFEINGNQEIIEKIVGKATEYQFVSERNRYFYEVTKDTFVKHNSTEKIRLATLSDLTELTKMTLLFFEEEYYGKNNKEYEKTEIIIKNHIIDKTYYVLESTSGTLIGFCSIMETNTQNLMIGTVFIKRKFRNKNKGIEILNYVTEKILMNCDFCWLMTTQENIISSKMVEKNGYYKRFNFASKKIIKVANTVQKQ